MTCFLHYNDEYSAAVARHKLDGYRNPKLSDSFVKAVVTLENLAPPHRGTYVFE